MNSPKANQLVRRKQASLSCATSRPDQLLISLSTDPVRRNIIGNIRVLQDDLFVYTPIRRLAHSMNANWLKWKIQLKSDQWGTFIFSKISTLNHRQRTNTQWVTHANWEPYSSSVKSMEESAPRTQPQAHKRSSKKIVKFANPEQIACGLRVLIVKRGASIQASNLKTCSPLKGTFGNACIRFARVEKFVARCLNAWTLSERPGLSVCSNYIVVAGRAATASLDCDRRLEHTL